MTRLLSKHEQLMKIDTKQIPQEHENLNLANATGGRIQKSKHSATQVQVPFTKLMISSATETDGMNTLTSMVIIGTRKRLLIRLSF